MAAPVTGVGSTPWGQTKKTGTEAEAVAATQEGAEGADATAEPSGAAVSTGTAATISVGSSFQIAPMPERLRDLIVRHSAPAPSAPTALASAAESIASARESMPTLSVAAADVQRTRAQIIADASRSMIAQATQTRESALALLTSPAAN